MPRRAQQSAVGQQANGAELRPHRQVGAVGILARSTRPTEDRTAFGYFFSVVFVRFWKRSDPDAEHRVVPDDCECRLPDLQAFLRRSLVVRPNGIRIVQLPERPEPIPDVLGRSGNDHEQTGADSDEGLYLVLRPPHQYERCARTSDKHTAGAGEQDDYANQGEAGENPEACRATAEDVQQRPPDGGGEERSCGEVVRVVPDVIP